MVNVLYIAYSCSPYSGSEDKIGWSVPFESAKENCVYVITKEEQREPVERYLSEHKLENIEFYYVDIPVFYKKIFKGFSYSGRLNIWHRCVFSLAKHICDEKQIDIIHQITPVEFRAIGNYGKIQNVKFVCGPLGGGEEIPTGLKSYARGNFLNENVRKSMNQYYRLVFKLTDKLNKCDKVVFANKETADYLGNLNLNKDEQLFSEIGLSSDELGKYKDVTTEGTRKECVFLFAGRLIYRKGCSFLLDALERIPDEMTFQCRIVGEGSKLEELKERVARSKILSGRVVFVGKVAYTEMMWEYKKASVFVLPSIRETTGTVILEAMSKSLPVVTINKYGGAVLLNEDTGWLYYGNDKNEYVDNLTKVLIECIQHPEEVERRGRNSRIQAEQHLWSEKLKYYNLIYSEVLKEDE